MASITTALSSYPVALTTSNNEKVRPLRPRLFVIILFPLFNFTSPRVTRRSPGQNRGLRFWGQPHAENQMQKLMNETFFLIGFEVFCRASIPRLPQQNHGRSPAKFADRMRIPIGRISSFPAERTLKFQCHPRIPAPKRQRSINLVSIQTPPTFCVILQVSQKKGTRSWYTASHDALRQRPERDGRRSFSRVGHRPCQNRKRSDIHLQTASADR